MIEQATVLSSWLAIGDQPKSSRNLRQSWRGLAPRARRAGVIARSQATFSGMQRGGEMPLVVSPQA